MRKFLLIGTLLIVGCSQQPASVQNYGVQKGAGSTGIHTVLPGDTVYSIAQNYGLPMREVITLNKLVPPYNLNVGDRVQLPPPNNYTVRNGDTIFSVARMHEVSTNRLVSLNNLQQPFNIRAGQTLRLPSSTTKQQAVRRGPVTRIAKNNTVERVALPAKKPNHVVSEVPQQAQRYGTSVLQKAGVAGVPPAPTAPVTTATSSVKKVSVPQRKSTSVPKLSGKSNFMRPIDGKVLSTYGPKENGLHNDGINIQGVRGTPVRAAENGVIVYNGNDLPGYGNLVLVKHENKLVSAYAHLDKALVKRGAKVTRGQAIGTVGSTGQVDKPQLHFEIRKGSTPLNPNKYL